MAYCIGVSVIRDHPLALIKSEAQKLLSLLSFYKDSTLDRENMRGERNVIHVADTSIT